MLEEEGEDPAPDGFMVVGLGNEARFFIPIFLLDPSIVGVLQVCVCVCVLVFCGGRGNGYDGLGGEVDVDALFQWKRDAKKKQKAKKRRKKNGRE